MLITNAYLPAINLEGRESRKGHVWVHKDYIIIIIAPLSQTLWNRGEPRSKEPGHEVAAPGNDHHS